MAGILPTDGKHAHDAEECAAVLIKPMDGTGYIILMFALLNLHP